MKVFSFPLLLGAILCLVGQNAQALSFGLPSSRRRTASAAGKKSSSAPPQDLQVQQKQKAGMTNLRFQAATNYATQPTKLHDDDDSSLNDFFFCNDIRDMILAGGSDKDSNNKNSLQVLNKPDVTLYNLWKVEASNAGFETPLVGDAILCVTTNGIHFPGLTIRTRATVGCKKVLVDTTPQLQITLITDELQAQGPDSLVWVFRQLTGGKKQRSSSSERRTHSTNTISAEKQSDGNVLFRSVATLTIDVNFPSLLMSVLPVSKEMAQRQGSDSIRKVVERDIGPALEAVSKLYMNTGDSHTTE